MTLSNLHTYIKLEIDKSNISGYPSFLPEEIDYFINTSITRFYKRKYSGISAIGGSFQQNQLRGDDFRNIVKTEKILANDMTVSGNEYIAEYPSDYWIGVGESVYIYSMLSNWPKDNTNTPIKKRVDVLEKTIENLDSSLNNSLSEHILNREYARPIRVYMNNKIYLYTDTNYNIDSYSISYISKPEIVDWYSTLHDKDTYELTNVPDHAWDEIIAMSAKMAIENISDYRYQTYSAEINTVV